VLAQISRAVFLSYASQDAEAARRVGAALRAAGIEVWLDQSELRGGDAWDQKIRQQIRDCALFVPIISANTASRPEGYFRLEWALADQRTQMMARNKPFIVPVCVDATPDTGADVPDSFLRVQWTRLPAGEIPAAFCQRIATLLGTGAVAEPAPAGAAPPAPPGAAPPLPGAAPARRASAATRVRLIAAILVAAGLLAALILWRPWRMISGMPAARIAAATGAGPAVSEKSIAVLPFADMSEKHDQEYFSDGLAEELIDALTRIPNLRVPARTSSFSFKGKPTTVGEIARALGVSHVLEGSVRKSGEHLRITAQLVRADNGFHLWSQTYDRDVRDIFAVQDDIAHAVVEQLRITLLGSDAVAPKQAVSTEAHNLYLQARYLTDRDAPADLEQAVALYHRALTLEPNYAPAWAWLAFCHVRRVAQGLDPNTAAVVAQTTTAAQRAIALDPQLPQPYIVLAITHLQYDLDWQAAADALAKVAALDPNNALSQQIQGHLSVATGRMSDAVAHFRRAVEGDPLNLLHAKYLGRALHYARRPAESAAVLRHAIELNAQFPGLHYELGRALLQLGDLQAARAAFEAETDPAWRTFGLPIGYHVTHHDPEARAALATLVEHSAGSEFQIAETYALFGERDKSLEWLERARTLHDPGIIYTRRDPLLVSIVGDPRYRALLERTRMPPVSKDD
jgi:TolB-like protein/tetratricopeptide (TPR) repeat protein